MSHGLGGDPTITIAVGVVGGAAIWAGTYAAERDKGKTHKEACHRANHRTTEKIHHFLHEKGQEARVEAMRNLYT